VAVCYSRPHLDHLVEQACVLDGNDGRIAKVSTSASSLAVKARGSVRHIAIAPMRTPSRRIGTPTVDAQPAHLDGGPIQRCRGR